MSRKVELCNCGVEYLVWNRATNENGWTCLKCGTKPGEPPGFCPDLDRSQIAIKVDCLLRDLVDANFVHVSNASDGAMLTDAVVYSCQKSGLFDQQYIIQKIVSAWIERHSEYWRKVSEGVLQGHDIRSRCPCGELATSTSRQGGGPTIERCTKHAGEQGERKLKQYLNERQPLFAGIES